MSGSSESARTKLLMATSLEVESPCHLVNLPARIQLKSLCQRFVKMDKGQRDYQSQGSQLRKVLNVMFPVEYIQLYHSPPKAVCSLLNIRSWPRKWDIRQEAVDRATTGKITTNESRTVYEVSTEPSSRAYLLNLRDQFDASLVGHQAKPLGLCPIRRAIYDQCFDELIRQVTVGCIEQGLLLFRIRNELRMTLDYYRKAYRSGVEFGLRKAIDAELSLNESRQRQLPSEELPNRQRAQASPDGQVDRRPLIDRVTNMELKNKLESFDRTVAYYKKQLIEKDKVIERQRAAIKALSQEAYSDIKDSVSR